MVGYRCCVWVFGYGGPVEALRGAEIGKVDGYCGGFIDCWEELECWVFWESSSRTFLLDWELLYVVRCRLGT